MAPPPLAPDWWQYNSAFVLGPAIGAPSALLLLCLGVGLSHALRQKRERRARLRTKALEQLSSEYNASIVFAVRSLPTRAWGAPRASAGGDGHGGPRYQEEECAVCLTPFVAGEEVRDLPCGHSFKRACIDEWLNNKGRPKQTVGQLVHGLASCPLCKKVPIEVSAAPKEDDVIKLISRLESTTTRPGSMLQRNPPRVQPIAPADELPRPQSPTAWPPPPGESDL